MSGLKAVPECIRCGLLEFDGVWMRPRKAPAHSPVYKHTMCLECKRIIKSKQVFCDDKGICPDKKRSEGDWVCKSKKHCQHQKAGGQQ